MATNDNYFLNFPVMNYGGYAATNIMARAVVSDLYVNNFDLLYDWTVPSGKKATDVAFDLYGKAEDVWVLYLVNQIVDPYFDWPLSDENFTNFINDKYGSIANAQTQVLFYRNNWPSDDNRITTAAYAALASDQKQYWKPQLIPGNRILNYYRNPADTVVSTNQLMTAQVTYNSNVAFQDGEFVTQGNNATGFISPNSIGGASFQHINGAFVSNAAPVVGTVTGASANLVFNSLFVQNVIPLDQTAYFSPVVAYDYEVELNQQKSLIKLLRVEYLPTLKNALAQALSS
jgi:hypothetical protein